MELRPKSAPVPNTRARTSSAGLTRSFDSSNHGDGGCTSTLEDKVSRFHTTDRVLLRMKERRRTLADINVNEKPAGLLAMELPSRKLSRVEADNLVARVAQPTASFLSRISSSRRRNASEIYVPPKQPVRIQYFQLDCDRFKGNRSISGKALSSLVNRLSSYDTQRRPPESRRAQTPDLRKQLGPLASYRWKGIKNC